VALVEPVLLVEQVVLPIQAEALLLEPEQAVEQPQGPQQQAEIPMPVRELLAVQECQFQVEIVAAEQVLLATLLQEHR